MRSPRHSVCAKLMDRLLLPEYAAHHAAKHALLRAYSNVWLPKLGFVYPQVAIVDGFASTGRYRDGTPGSPLILLRAYVGRSDHHRFKAAPQFIFIESKRNFAEHLQAEIEAMGDLKGAQVQVIHGTYEERFPLVIERLVRMKGRGRLPVFAFIDPRGYKETPFELIRRYRRELGEKAEAMVYLPVNFMSRFMMTDLTEAALRKTFGGAEGLERVRKHPEEVDRKAGERIAGGFAELMRGEYDFVTQFTVDPVHHNEYHLFFGTGSLHGVREMKRAYWKVDRVAGSGYQQDARLAAGQVPLFPTAEIEELAPEDTLPALLREHYGDHVFDIEEAERWTLLETRFLDKPHLRQQALIPLRAAGSLEVLESRGWRDTHFPPGTRMRLVD
jgi:three-Cys-motif partner protein